ncbi:hypothetical protein [Pseudomonas canadensis]|uniref:hypothetical protein n=1 Tax=Pseudomonas canadensis TaxID=915099 RepID=UPI0028933C5B|nr:hypothetical protein [Pseudomonas canadensis]WNJ86078.1 hypothetical protein RMQ99_05715 [Pseudomonas canadensis]
MKQSLASQAKLLAIRLFHNGDCIRRKKPPICILTLARPTVSVRLHPCTHAVLYLEGTIYL